MSSSDRWIPFPELIFAGVNRDLVVKRVNEGKWQMRQREGDRVWMLRFDSLPTIIQRKLDKMAAKTQDAIYKEKHPEARDAFSDMVHLQQIPDKDRVFVRVAFSEIIERRQRLLDCWADIKDEIAGWQPGKRSSAVRDLSRAWVDSAKPIGHLYPSLLMYPLPSRLSQFLEDSRKAESPVKYAEVVLDGATLKPDVQVIKKLQEAVRG